MDARELREGNYFKYSDSVRANKVPNDYYTVEGWNHYDLNEYKEPIPLTEEWLRRLGFERGNCGEIVLFNKVFTIEVEDNKFWFGCDCHSIEREIKHVHQLQNLYFALTGEELKIKE